MHGVYTADLGEILPLWSALPFIGMLLSIALFPLFAPKFWHDHFGKVSLFWALVIAIPFLVIYKARALHTTSTITH
ncbi:MAG: sodium:proton antiporter, partial [Candidatus Mariimomonas ferrooxydans]